MSRVDELYASCARATVALRPPPPGLHPTGRPSASCIPPLNNGRPSYAGGRHQLYVMTTVEGPLLTSLLPFRFTGST